VEEFQKLNPKIMETFYRYMRKKTGLLMVGVNPEGGKWNFDKMNRKKIPKDIEFVEIPKTKLSQITQEVIGVVEGRFNNNPGTLDNFWTGVTREHALTDLNNFIKNCLFHFGEYQDAMRAGDNISFHSGLSHYLNIGLLSPIEVCKSVESADVPLESKEGYIRQIIGWREFIRGIYWKHMPGYKLLNSLQFKNNLPSFYWDGKTDMNCMKNALDSTLHYSYAHHIQRLMITGNYATLLNVDPKEINEWYLCVYLDAHEWVQLPNTHGMALHADGGIVGTKPYICSASYINKMSDYCKNCKYNYKSSEDDNACPFNFLYWNFLMTHDFSKNPRMSLPYAILNRMDPKLKNNIKKSADSYSKSIKS
jgi:deoxyribodipyrimidine photolyase-related protein